MILQCESRATEVDAMYLNIFDDLRCKIIARDTE